MNVLKDFWSRVTWPITWYRLFTRRMDVLAYRTETLIDAIRSKCAHEHIQIVDAHIMNSRRGLDYGYKYLKVFARCDTCGNEWFLQGRTDGLRSSNPTDPVFYGNS